MKNKHFCFFIGTTAEFIKLAPVIKEFKKKQVKFQIVTSGQNIIHFDELSSFTGKVTPDVALPLKISRSSIFGFFLWSIRTIALTWKLLDKEVKKYGKTNFYLIIHGDTISSLIGTLVGRLYGITVVQIESGLRSFNLLEPIPEEISRRIITKFANVFFAPNSWSLKNLNSAQGIKISTEENTLIETCLWAINKKTDSKITKGLRDYYILFIHRQEHIYINKNWTWDIIQTIMNNAPKDLSCVLVMHALTSRILTSKKIDELSQTNKNLVILPKLPYVDFLNLMNHAEFIATDSCTSQEEAHYLGLPYLGLRNLTERIEGLGKNVVISKGNRKTIIDFLHNYKKYKYPKIKTNVRPSQVIVKYLLNT